MRARRSPAPHHRRPLQALLIEANASPDVSHSTAVTAAIVPTRRRESSYGHKDCPINIIWGGMGAIVNIILGAPNLFQNLVISSMDCWSVSIIEFEFLN